jgi:universal stress protein A
MPIHTILCAHDLTESSDEALRQTLALARQLDARVVVLHVVAPPPPRERLFGVYSVEEMEHLTGFARREEDGASRALAERVAAAAGAAGSTCTTNVRTGPAVEVIAAQVDAERADLLVVGTHGRTGLHHAVVGSVAERLVRISPCPVLVARTRIPAP